MSNLKDLEGEEAQALAMLMTMQENLRVANQSWENAVAVKDKAYSSWMKAMGRRRAEEERLRGYPKSTGGMPANEN